MPDEPIPEANLQAPARLYAICEGHGHEPPSELLLDREQAIEQARSMQDSIGSFPAMVDEFVFDGTKYVGGDCIFPTTQDREEARRVYGRDR
jgi:hypothetical protein